MLQKIKAIFIISIIGAFWPYLGIPRAYKDFVTFLLCVSVAAIAFSIWKKQRFGKKDFEKATIVTDTFVESNEKKSL